MTCILVNIAAVTVLKVHSVPQLMIDIDRAGVGFLGRGSQPSPPARRSGECWKFQQRDLGQSPGRYKVFLHSRGARPPLLELVGRQVRGPWLPWPPEIRLYRIAKAAV